MFQVYSQYCCLKTCKIKYGLMLLWSTDLVNVTEEVKIHRPNALTLLSSAFSRGDLNTATRGPFIQTSVWYMFERASKAVFFHKKETSALLEYTCLTNHTIG